jgi:colicin import membrane protein
MAMNGIAVGGLGIGALFLYSAIKGKSILASAQSVITGQSPATAPAALPIEGNTAQQVASLTPPAPNTTTGVGPVANAGTNESILRQTAAKFGWTGAEWSALNDIEEEEAGYSATIANPDSGALGMAQALGHGNAATVGTLGNEYGGYGLSDAQAKAANSGDAAMQSLWMCNYIQSVYGDPITAQAFHLAHNYY